MCQSVVVWPSVDLYLQAHDYTEPVRLVVEAADADVDVAVGTFDDNGLHLYGEQRASQRRHPSAQPMRLPSC